MHKSPRYDYARWPCYDPLNKKARRKLHKSFRRWQREVLRLRGEFEPMPRRASWG